MSAHPRFASPPWVTWAARSARHYSSTRRSPPPPPASGVESPPMSMGAWHDRDEWLSLLEELVDPPTIRRLETVEVGPGWQALEVGAGRGSIAAWLAERVGEGGRV